MEPTTIVCTPDARKLALAFAGRLQPGAVITEAAVRELPDDVQIQLVWALRKHGYDVQTDPSVGGWKVVRRARA